MKRLSALLVCSILVGCTAAPSSPATGTGSTQTPLSLSDAIRTFESQEFGKSVSYSDPSVTIAQNLGADFSVNEITNLTDIEKAYGFKLSAKEKQMLEKNKFVMLPLSETSITPKLSGELTREFIGLYNAVTGPSYDYKGRTQANSVFITSDIFFHSYNLLYTELLKEMENTAFIPSMKNLSEKFFSEADRKFASSNGDEKEEWRKVRNYFAVPYILLSTAKEPPSPHQFVAGDDPSAMALAENDAKADSIGTATAFLNNLNIDPASKKEILDDLTQVYNADDKGTPAIFEEEYARYAEESGVQFQVDFSQFTPRSHYTGSSWRRQYFRSMMWYSQLPLFIKSPELTKYAFAMSQLLAENTQQLKDYAKLESTINFLVGESDDLMPVDYMQALLNSEGKSDQEAAMMEYLAKARPPKIKNIAAQYPTVGDVETADVLLLTKGMRFFSGKFIIDSYWTGQLTQGDEAPKPGYTQKLPPMASSLEVMSLLGSDYATSKIPTLDFYKLETKEAIDKAMADLKAEANTFNESYWTSNLYNGWLWTIKSLFTWQQTHRDALPRFMQSELWPVKTLMTGAGFWTELRHATLLYAKQSFAELGGGGQCDPRKVPPPPKGYIEPQIEAYTRLQYLAQRNLEGLKELGFDDLRNIGPLEFFVTALDKAKTYSIKLLENQTFAAEVVEEHRDTDPEGEECIWYSMNAEESDWEQLRTGIISALANSLPWPVEGPVLSAKDKRAALIADVHTGGDSQNPPRILYEGTGVPSVILVAVKDANGPRLTIGFTYTQYEFTEPYGGQRKTDEQWQENFYVGIDDMNPFEYKPRSSWPALPSWFTPLFGR